MGFVALQEIQFKRDPRPRTRQAYPREAFSSTIIFRNANITTSASVAHRSTHPNGQRWAHQKSFVFRHPDHQHDVLPGFLVAGLLDCHLGKQVPVMPLKLIFSELGDHMDGNINIQFQNKGVQFVSRRLGRQQGQFLVKTNYLSVDPYMRGRISEGPSYAAPVEIGPVMVGGTVGTVLESRHSHYRSGEVVVGYGGWQEYFHSDGQGVERFDISWAPMSTALGVLGMTGMTAYFGLLEIGKPGAGETVFVSVAAGAVGSLVGQIAKIQGCRVVGCAGSPQKVDYLTAELGLEAAFNSKEVKDYAAMLQVVCPHRVDVYFDNVGGSLTDAVFTQINVGARIVVCGQIDQYNATRPPRGPRFLWHLIVKQARAEGFLVFQFADRFAEGRRQIALWLKEGRIKYRETIVDGLENAPQAFIGLFHGENFGKQLVRVAA
jgi:NADPH:quinone reductase